MEKHFIMVFNRFTFGEVTPFADEMAGHRSKQKERVIYEGYDENDLHKMP